MPLFARFVYSWLAWRTRRSARSTNAPSERTAAESLGKAAHLVTGERGETLAYWYLRREGYRMVARNLRLGSGAGELDLVGWDGSVLVFIEVKTRTSVDAGLPEEAVNTRQQQRIRTAAEVYMRRLNRKELNYRFDIVSVLWDDAASLSVRLIKDAFRPKSR